MERCLDMRLLPLLLALLALTGSATAFEARWATAGLSAMRTRWADTGLYREASAWTRSGWLSGGAGERWWAAAGGSRIELSQPDWSWSAGRWTVAGARLLGPGLRLEGGGFHERADGDYGGWGAQAGLALLEGLPRTARGLRLRLGLARHFVEGSPEDDRPRLLQGALGGFAATAGGQGSLTLLHSRRDSRSGSGLLLRWERRPARGLGLAIDALAASGLECWYDAERMAVHNSPQPLRAIASAGLSWRAAGGLGLLLSAGWTKLESHEQRWIWVGLSWTRLRWVLE
jgi:hypothetical protein